MPTVLTPYRIALFQLDFRVARAAEILCCWTCEFDAGCTVGGALRLEGGWGVGFAGHGCDGIGDEGISWRFDEEEWGNVNAVGN